MRRFTPTLAGCALALAVAVAAATEARAAVKSSSSPAAVTSTTGRLDVFVIGSDKRMYRCTHDGKTAKWTSLGGQCYYGAGAVEGLTGRLDVFTVAKDGSLVQKTHDREWSKEWKSLGTTPGGKCTSAPAAVLGRRGRIVVFVLGADRKTHQCSYDGKAWSWSTVGGTCYYGVGAATGGKELGVFTVAKSGSLVEASYDGKWSKDWKDLEQPSGGKCASAPSAVAGKGHMDVFVLGSDKKAYQAHHDGKNWKWSSLGGDCRYGIAATRSTTGKINVFTIAKSGSLVRRVFDGKTWSADWEDLGMPAE
jgi:hypothetical protein